MFPTPVLIKLKLQVAMRMYPIILLLAITICPTVAEVLTQSFVIRLKEMEQLIQDQKQVNDDQKQVNEDQQQIIESLKTGKINKKDISSISK